MRIIVVTEKGSDCLSERLESKKRNRKVLITDRAIKKVPRIEYKEIPEDEYDNIWDLAKQVLEISQKAKFKEDTESGRLFFEELF